ncbi:zinc finger, C2H2 type [Cooperia oncophora]
MIQEDKVPKSEVTGKAEQFSVTSALELLCNAGPSVTAHDDLDLDVTAAERTGTPRPSKRIARIEKLGLETFTCQLCKKSITRQGQYANLVNHLSRHARLHASKKQYCCPVCRASFSRRYLAYAHVREAHTKHGYVEPVDHGRELREEYRSLLEVCFPGASTRRKTASHLSTANKGNRTDKKGKGTAHTAPTYKDELSRLLE